MPIRSIAVAGTFSAGSLETSYVRAFKEIGVRTVIVDLGELRCNLGWLMRNRITHRLTIHSRVIRERASRVFNHYLEQAVRLSNAPALFLVKGEFVTPETLHNIRRIGMRVVCYYPDNPFPPYSNHRPETLAAARETDLYLIWSERLVKKLIDSGVSNPVFLPFAWDPEVFPYQEFQPQGAWPGVLFLGGWDRERAEFLEELASHIPLRIYGPPYWGTRTKTRSRIRRCWQGSDLRLGNAARVVRESAISLNLLRTQHLIDGEPDGLIMRHFEVPGAGGFLLSTRGGGATALFPEGHAGEYFSDIAECVGKARYYIANDLARKKVAAHAHAIVASKHHYADRAQTILRLLQDCP